jgi:hypothetical protein
MTLRHGVSGLNPTSIIFQGNVTTVSSTATQPCLAYALTILEMAASVHREQMN